MPLYLTQNENQSLFNGLQGPPQSGLHQLSDSMLCHPYLSLYILAILPPCCSLNIPSKLLPQGLCTCRFIFLGYLCSYFLDSCMACFFPSSGLFKCHSFRQPFLKHLAENNDYTVTPLLSVHFTPIFPIVLISTWRMIQVCVFDIFPPTRI